MSELSSLGKFITDTLTFGGVGVWTLVIMGLIGFWKGLPAILDAWSARADKEAARTDREIARLERQIVASDARHGECMAGQQLLRNEVDRLQKVIDGLIYQMRQLQLSAARVDGIELSPPITAMLESLDRIASKG